MIRIFVPPGALVAGELVVRGDEHHYLARVRRARPGDAIELCDGLGRRAAATIVRLSDGETALVAAAPETIAAAPPFVRALVPLIKGDRMDACIEKLVEVGVDAIVVWPAARSVVRLDDARRDSRVARYHTVAQAAARQSGRAQVPPVSAAASLSAALADLPGGLQLVLDPACGASLAVGDAADVTIVSGPEGGLSSDEHDRLAAFTPVGLGPRVLRADTAPVVAVAVIRAATHS